MMDFSKKDLNLPQGVEIISKLFIFKIPEAKLNSFGWTDKRDFQEGNLYLISDKRSNFSAQRGSCWNLTQGFLGQNIIMRFSHKTFHFNAWLRIFEICGLPRNLDLEKLLSNNHVICAKGIVVRINRFFWWCRILYYTTLQPTLQLIQYQSYKLNLWWSTGRWLQ